MPYEQRPVPVCDCGNHDPHVHLAMPIIVAAAILTVLLVAGSLLAASRPASDDSPRRALAEVPSPGFSDGTSPSPALAPGAGSEGTTVPTTPMPAHPPGEIGMPLSGIRYTGTATWYCGHGAACTRGYRPSDLIAAIDRKDTTFRKGDRVVVRYGRKHVTVRIVDVCACVDRRVIDLSTGAFLRLAPLGLGVLPVTVELAGQAVTPPQTDEGQP